MTRARKHLTLSSAIRRQLYRFTQFNPVSRFIQEIPSALILSMGEHASLSNPRKKQRSSWNRNGFDDFNQAQHDDFEPSWQLDSANTSPYKPGARILHPKFGQGTVKKCEGNPDNLKLTVQFKTSGLKKILLNYCSVELLDR